VLTSFSSDSGSEVVAGCDRDDDDDDDDDEDVEDAHKEDSFKRVLDQEDGTEAAAAEEGAGTIGEERPGAALTVVAPLREATCAVT